MLGAAGTMGELSYSRSDETEADDGAATLLARAGIPPEAMIRALDDVSRGDSDVRGESALDFLSTHPANAGRRAHAREVAAGLTVTPVAPDTATWAVMREALDTSSDRF